MVHNAIEYGMMQAYAEGFSILETQGGVPAGPGGDFARYGGWASVIRSWLLDLTTDALHKNPTWTGWRRTWSIRARDGGRYLRRSI